MGAEDKIKNVAEDVVGKVKEQFGKLTGQEDVEHEGQVDQAKSDLKQAGEKVKDAIDPDQ